MIRKSTKLTISFSFLILALTILAVIGIKYDVPYLGFGIPFLLPIFAVGRSIIIRTIATESPNDTHVLSAATRFMILPKGYGDGDCTPNKSASDNTVSHPDNRCN